MVGRLFFSVFFFAPNSSQEEPEVSHNEREITAQCVHSNCVEFSLQQCVRKPDSFSAQFRISFRPPTKMITCTI